MTVIVRAGLLTEAALSLSDVTTADVSITKHGLAPKAPNDATKFLNGVGGYSVPAGGGGSPAFSAVTAGTNTAALVVGTSGTLTPTSTGKIQATDFGGMIDATRYGCVGDGTTDNSTPIANALAALTAAGGGVLFFPPGTYKVVSQIVIPNDGTSTPYYKQKPIRLTGVAPASGYLARGTGGSVLDLRYSGNAYIAAYGSGYLEIDHLTLKNGNTGGGITSAFILTTNTTLNIHDLAILGDTSLGGTTNIQDAIVLGAGGTSPDNTTSSAFSGYGTIISTVFADFIKRFLYVNSGPLWTVNGIQVVNNTIWAGCGSNDTSNGAAIDFGASGPHKGNYIAGNLFEGTYKWFVRVINGEGNQFIGNSIFDATMTAIYRFETASAFNLILHSYGGAAATVMSDATAGNNVLLSTANGVNTSWGKPWTFTDSLYPAKSTNSVKVRQFGEYNWSSSSDPTASTQQRITQWDSTTTTIDSGTIRVFKDLRVGALYGTRPVRSRTADLAVSVTDDHNTVFTNAGASGTVIFTLPTSATVGMTFSFYVDVAQTLQIKAPTSVVVRIGPDASTAAGTASAATIGNSVTLVYTKTNLWAAMAVIGTWTAA